MKILHHFHTLQHFFLFLYSKFSRYAELLTRTRTAGKFGKFNFFYFFIFIFVVIIKIYLPPPHRNNFSFFFCFFFTFVLHEKIQFGTISLFSASFSFICNIEILCITQHKNKKRKRNEEIFSLIFLHKFSRFAFFLFFPLLFVVVDEHADDIINLKAVLCHTHICTKEKKTVKLLTKSHITHRILVATKTKNKTKKKNQKGKWKTRNCMPYIRMENGKSFFPAFNTLVCHRVRYTTDVHIVYCTSIQCFFFPRRRCEKIAEKMRAKFCLARRRKWNCGK